MLAQHTETQDSSPDCFSGVTDAKIRPSALRCRIRVPFFIKIRTIRKSGYFARVLELRPLSRCQESSSRSCRSSRSKSICSKGSANPGKRFNASTPSPGWQVLRFVAIMSVPPVRLRSHYVPANCDTVGRQMPETYGDPEDYDR